MTWKPPTPLLISTARRSLGTICGLTKRLHASNAVDHEGAVSPALVPDKPGKGDIGAGLLDKSWCDVHDRRGSCGWRCNHRPETRFEGCPQSDSFKKGDPRRS